MRSSRAHFKYALKFTIRIEDTAKADALAKDLGGQKHDDFWKSVSKIKQNSQLQLLLLMVLMVKPTSQTTGVIIFTAY